MLVTGFTQSRKDSQRRRSYVLLRERKGGRDDLAPPLKIWLSRSAVSG